MALAKIEGRITIPALGYAMTVNEGGSDVSLTVVTSGNYYLSSSTSLLTAIAASLDAGVGLIGTYAVTLDDDTGKVTIAATGIPSLAITFTDSDLRALLGFAVAQVLTGSVSYQSQGSSTAVWLPPNKRSNPPVPDGHVGMPLTDGTITMAPSGQTKAMKFASRSVNSLLFRYIPGNKVWTAFESVANESWESFWTAHVSKGYPVRYHADRSVDGTFVSWRLMNIDSMMVQAEIPNFTGETVTPRGASTLWSVGDIECAELVT